MNKSDIVDYTRKILLLLSEQGTQLPGYITRLINEYNSQLEDIPFKDNSIDFLFISTALLMNEGLVPNITLQELLDKSFIEDIGTSLIDNEELLVLLSSGKRPVNASLIYQKNPTPLSDSSDTRTIDNTFFLSDVDVDEIVQDDLEVKRYVISKLRNFYYEKLEDLIYDDSYNSLYERFIEIYSSLFYDKRNDDYSFEHDIDDEDSEFNSNDYYGSIDELNRINDIFLRDYNVNLFEVIKDFRMNYYYKTKKEITLLRELLDKGDKEFDKVMSDDSNEEIFSHNSGIFSENTGIYEKVDDDRYVLNIIKLALFTRNALAHNDYELLENNKIHLFRKIVVDDEEKTIFNVVMDLNFVKKISDSIENACYDIYKTILLKKERCVPISPNFIYDEEFNKDMEKNEFNTVGSLYYETKRDESILEFEILCLLNANIMALHNIDKNQVNSKLNFSYMDLDEASEINYIEKLINLAEAQVNAKKIEIEEAEKDSNVNKVTEIIKRFIDNRKDNDLRKFFDKVTVDAFEKTPFEGNLKVYLNTVLARADAENKINMDKYFEKSKSESANSVQRKFYPNNKIIKSKGFIERVISQEDKIYENNLIITIYTNYINKLKNALDKFKNGDKKALKPYEFGEEYTKFILRNIRTALAHGGVMFEHKTPIDQTVIIFKLYDRDTKKNKTFEGKITFGDLLSTILTKGHLDELLDRPHKVGVL